MTVKLWIRIAMFSFITSINIALMASFLYWLIIFDPNIEELDYERIMSHGILFFMVLFDGMIVNRIPIQLKQIFFVQGLALAYTLWLIIQSFSPSIGNPYSEDYESVYEIVNFNEHPGKSAILCSLCVFIASPSTFFAIFLLSLLFKPRYHHSPPPCPRHGAANKEDEEEGEESRPHHHVTNNNDEEEDEDGQI